LSESAINGLCHEFLGTIVQDELENQALKGFRDVLFVIPHFVFVKPVSVDNKEGCQIAEQGQQGSESGMREFFQRFLFTQ